MPMPTHKPTDIQRENVTALCCLGISGRIISKFLGIDEKTLMKHYREELDHGLSTRKAKVMNVLFEKAVIDKDTTSLIFLAKTLCGLRETNRHEVTGADGKAMQIETKYKDVDVLVQERLKEILNRNGKELIDVSRDEPK